MSGATHSATCAGCGRSKAAACPTLGDVMTAFAALAAAGRGHEPGTGRRLCPACLRAAPAGATFSISATVPPPAQPDLSGAARG